MERARIQESDDGESLAHLRRIIDKAKVAMLTTLTGEQQMRSRPLFTERMDDDGALWFIIKGSSPKTNEIYVHGGQVCLTYVDLANQNFASLTGTAHLVDDPQLKAALWGPMSEIWFPKGKDDPDASLLKIVPESGEYWDGPATAAGRLLAFAKAAVTGDTSGFGTQRKFKVR